MALPKPSPGLLPAENYRRFGVAFDQIDAATAANEAQGASIVDLLARLLRINSGLYPAHRPGDNPTSFTGSPAGGDPDALPPLSPGDYPAAVVGRGLGRAVRNSRQVWSRAFLPVAPGRLYRFRYGYVRTVNPQDPSNDAVQGIVAWYGADRTLLSSGQFVSVFTDTPSVSDGDRVRGGFIGDAGATAVDVGRPAGAAYARIGFAVYGNEATTVLTDLAAIDVTDVAEAVTRLVPPDSIPTVIARLDDLEADLENEAQTRRGQDEALGGRIDGEVLSRGMADAGINLRIDGEIKARGDADVALGLRIDGETAARIAAVLDLFNSLGAVQDALSAEAGDLFALAKLIGQAAAAAADVSAQAVCEALDVEPRQAMPMSFTIPNADPPQGQPIEGVTVAATDRVLKVYLISGQSNALGATVGGYVGTQLLYPYRALMPDTGLHVSGNLRGDRGYLTSLRGLKPLLEGQDSYPHETLASGFANHLLRDLDAANVGNGLYRPPRIATMISAIGSRSYGQLKMGSEASENAKNALAAMTRILAEQGVRVVLAGVLWVQGENDTAGLWGARYGLMLSQHQRNWDMEAKRITGQVEPVTLYVSQVGAVNAFDAASTGQRLQQEQLEAGLRNPNVVCVGPTYACPRNTADYVHLTAVGQNRLGMLFSRAVFAHEYSVGWAPLRVRQAYFTPVPLDGTSRIVVELDVPVEPVVLDLSGADVALGSLGNGRGLRCWAPDGTEIPILTAGVLQPKTNYGVVPSLYVDIATPAVPWVRLGAAQVRDGDQGSTTTPDGPLTGARTLFRDSAGQVSLYDGRPNHNWLAMQTMRVIANAAPSGGSF